MICRWLPAHWTAFAFSRDLFSAGISIAARIAMMAITTNSSIKVNFLMISPWFYWETADGTMVWTVSPGRSTGES